MKHYIIYGLLIALADIIGILILKSEFKYVDGLPDDYNIFYGIIIIVTIILQIAALEILNIYYITHYNGDTRTKN